MKEAVTAFVVVIENAELPPICVTQPLASVMTSVYTPGPTFDRFRVVSMVAPAAFCHAYEYGLWPEMIVTPVIAPVAAPQVAPVTTAVDVSATGSGLK